jgi:membrane protease YdiL (CAAX protease family)
MDSHRESQPQHRPGPGLFESLLWVTGCHAAQLAVVVLLATGLLWVAAPSFPPALETVIRIVDQLGWQTSFLFTGAATLAAFLVIAPLVRLRVGRKLRSEFGFRRLTAIETLLIVAAVAPLALVSDEVYRWGLPVNALLAELSPELQLLGTLDAMQLIQEQAASTTYPVLLVAIALAPAMTEELVFRGLIGRGLTARWGVTGGVLLTTLLFAGAHGTPAHALGTVPVGLCLHLVYRVTGTLWAPILLHTLNNSLAVTLMKLEAGVALPATAALLCAACGYLAVVGVLLQQSTAGKPEGQINGEAVVLRLRAGEAFPMLAAGSIVTYTAVFIWSRVSML